MITLLLGTDFMYNSNDELVPIQINTAISIDNVNRVEDDNFIFDLTDFKKFVEENKFKKIYYTGEIDILDQELKMLSNELSIEYFYYKVEPPALTIPYIEDNDSTLIIRSAYDCHAIVDSKYCVNRVNFQDIIKGEKYHSEICFMSGNRKLFNNITTIFDNGVHPNFILKSVFPDYNRKKFPKLFKVSNQEELNVIIKNVTPNYFLMPFHFSKNNLYDRHIKNIRSMNILISPNLESINVGGFTKISEKDCSVIPEYNEKFELKNSYKSSYLTIDDKNINDSKSRKMKRILTDVEINKMNEIMSSFGNVIIEKYS